jgi:hypothetical protein
MTARSNWNDSKANAKRRAIEFNLTFEEYSELRMSQCAYGISIANGVDRKNNKQPYTMDNCTPCCFRHNMIKGSIFTYEEMLLIVQQCPSAKACGTWDEARANAKRNANGLSRWQASNMSLDEQGRTAEKSERAIKAQETMDRNAQTVR